MRIMLFIVCLSESFWFRGSACFAYEKTSGGARHFHLGGPLDGPVLQQGELSMVGVGLSEIISMQWHDVTRKSLGGPLGGPSKILGGQWRPLAPP